MKSALLPYAYHQHKIIDFKKAQISIATAGLQYGIGCFAGIRGYLQPDGQIAIFRLDDHVARLVKSVSLLNLKIHLNEGEIKQAIIRLVRRNKPVTDIYIRPFVYRSDLQIGPVLAGEYSLSIYMLSMGNYFSTTSGLDICVSSWIRTPDNAIPSKAKASGAYINSALAVDEAVSGGYDNAIMLDSQGNVTEGSAMNLFIVKASKLITPSTGVALLEGITRRSIIEIAANEGIDVIERNVARSELYQAQEAFFSGTAVQVAWIKQIDRRPISQKMGPLTKIIQTKLDQVVRGKDKQYDAWLTKIPKAKA